MQKITTETLNNISDFCNNPGTIRKIILGIAKIIYFFLQFPIKKFF